MNTLIVGATGRIGSVALQSLLADPGKANPIAACRTAEQEAAFAAQSVATRTLDLSEPATLPAALDGIDTLFLLTGYSVDMVVQSKAILDRARDAGVEHVVHLGVMAGTDTTVPHNAWHQMVESYVAQSGFSWTNLHPNWFMQLVPWICGEKLRDDGTLVYFIGDNPVSWIDSDDVGRAAAAVLRDPSAHAGKSYELAHEVASFPDLAGKMQAHYGKPYQYFDVTPEDFLASALEGGWIEQAYARSAAEMFKQRRADALPKATLVTDTYTALTGLEPVTWDTFIERERAQLEYGQTA